MAELAETLAPEDDDARLDQAQGVVRGYCGWHIAPSRADSVTVSGNRSAVIVLPSLHVTAVASVTCDGTVLDSAGYYWSEAGVLTRDCGIWSGREIVVEFTHGYDEVPAEVTGAVQAIAQRGIDNPKSLKSWTRGPFSETYGDNGTGSGDLAVLNRYKLPSRP